MSKKSKNKTNDKPKAAGKTSEKRLAAIESTLKKLLGVSDKLIARQKNGKQRSKRLSKDQRVLQQRLDDVETQITEQLQRVRSVAAENNTLRTRLETQSGIIKDNCARLDEFKPSLSDNQQQSQQLAHQITELIQQTEQITARSESLDRGLASLARRVEEQSAERGAAPSIDIEAFAAETAASEREQRESLEKLQMRLAILEGDVGDLEQGNRGLAQSLDDLSARAGELETQSRQFSEQRETLEAGGTGQQHLIESQGQQIEGLGGRLEELSGNVKQLSSELAEARAERQKDLESRQRLTQRLDELQQHLGDSEEQQLASLQKLNDATQGQLQEALDREGLLKQQIDGLSNRLNETAGSVAQLSSELAEARAGRQEDLESGQRLALRLDELQQHLGDSEEQQLVSLQELSDAMQQQLQEALDKEGSLKQQIDGLSGRLNETADKVAQLSSALAEARAGRQEDLESQQRLAQRLEKLQQDLSDSGPQTQASLQKLSDTTQRQLQEALDREGSLKQQIDDLGGRLNETANKVTQLSSELAQARAGRQEDLESQQRLAQRLEQLHQDLHDSEPQALASLQKLSDATQQQLQDALGREKSLRQQVDHLGGLLVTTEGQLTEQSAQLALEDARLAQQIQSLERRLTAFEGTAGELRTQDLASLKSLGDDLRQRQQEDGEREHALRRRLDEQANLLATTRNELQEQAAKLLSDDQQLREKVQSLEQNFDLQAQALDDKLSNELQALKGLTGILQQRVDETGDREQTLRQHLEDLDGLLTDTRDQLRQNAETSASEDKQLRETTQMLERRVDSQGRELGERLSKELESINVLTGSMQRQLQTTHERAQSLGQQVDDLEQELDSTGEKLTQQKDTLTERTAHFGAAHKTINMRQDRLSAGLYIAGLLIAALAVGGYWWIDNRLAESRQASIAELENLEQRVVQQEQLLVLQQAQQDEAETPQDISALVVALETRLAEHERLFALLEEQRDKETRSTQSALEKLRQGFAQQKQLISQETGDAGELRSALQQLQAAQLESERLLQRLAADQAQQAADSARLQDALNRVAARQEQALETRAAVVAAPPPAPVAESKDDGLRGVDWLRQLNPRHYLLQLVAAHNKAVILRVAAESGQAGRLAFYTGQFQGRDWHVLLYGDFTSRAQALAASRDLPESIRRYQPWLRSVSSVQSELPGR